MTRTIAAANERMRRVDAAAWSDRGRQRQRAGELDAAIASFRRAATRAPDDRRYALELADALGSAHRDVEARQALAVLREANPDDAEVNLRLARLNARDHNTLAARR